MPTADPTPPPRQPTTKDLLPLTTTDSPPPPPVTTEPPASQQPTVTEATTLVTTKSSTIEPPPEETSTTSRITNPPEHITTTSTTRRTTPPPPTPPTTPVLPPPIPLPSSVSLTTLSPTTITTATSRTTAHRTILSNTSTTTTPVPDDADVDPPQQEWPNRMGTPGHLQTWQVITIFVAVLAMMSACASVLLLGRWRRRRRRKSDDGDYDDDENGEYEGDSGGSGSGSEKNSSGFTGLERWEQVVKEAKRNGRAVGGGDRYGSISCDDDNRNDNSGANGHYRGAFDDSTGYHGDSQGYSGVGGGGIWVGDGAGGSNSYEAQRDGSDYSHFIPRSPEPKAYSGQGFSHDMMYACGLPSAGVDSGGDGYYGTHYMNEQYSAEYYAQGQRAGQGFYTEAPHPTQPVGPNQVVERIGYIDMYGHDQAVSHPTFSRQQGTGDYQNPSSSQPASSGDFDLSVDGGVNSPWDDPSMDRGNITQLQQQDDNNMGTATGDGNIK
ncbi:hypothetical protein BG004_004350, partial [Podila humilis]